MRDLLGLDKAMQRQRGALYDNLEGPWYSTNHVSRDHWRHSQSSTEFANSSRFTGSPVRGSQFAKFASSEKLMISAAQAN